MGASRAGLGNPEFAWEAAPGAEDTRAPRKRKNQTDEAGNVLAISRNPRATTQVQPVGCTTTGYRLQEGNENRSNGISDMEDVTEVVDRRG